MTRRGATAGSLIFVVAQPGLMGGLVPYWLTGGWESADSPLVLALVGAALLAAGLGFLAHTVIRFAVEGLGTPSPVAPTEKLVVGGVYRYLRNPMYVAVIAVILGQAAILGRPVLLVYAAIFWLVVASFVRFYEEPTLSRRYGEQYAAYRRAFHVAPTAEGRRAIARVAAVFDELGAALPEGTARMLAAVAAAGGCWLLCNVAFVAWLFWRPGR